MDRIGFIYVSVFGNLFDLSAMSLALGEERGGTCSRCRKKANLRTIDSPRHDINGLV